MKKEESYCRNSSVLNPMFCSKYPAVLRFPLCAALSSYWLLTHEQETLEIHHGKHHAAYVTNLNKQIEGKDLDSKSLEEVPPPNLLSHRMFLPRHSRTCSASLSQSGRSNRRRDVLLVKC
jgi:hypothetical protein